MKLSSFAPLRRGAILAFLAAAVLAPRDLGCRSKGPSAGTRVFLVDVSSSIDPDPRSALARGVAIVRERLDPLPADASVALIAFAGTSSVTVPPGPASRLRAPVSLPGALDPASLQATDLERAIRAGLDLLPDRASGSDLVLVTDGRETRGDARRAAREAASQGVPIHAVPLEPAPRAVPGILSLDGPAVVAGDAPIALRARIVAPADRAATVHVEIHGATGPLDDAAAATIDLAPRDERSVPLGVRPSGPGFHAFEAVLTEPGKRPAAPVPDRATHGLLVSGPPRAIVLSAQTAFTDRAGDPVRRMLEAAGFQVERASGDAGSEAFLGADLVVVHALPHARLSMGTERAVAAFVTESGAGLLYLGGRESFGPGGYRGTALESILPLDCGPEEPGPLRLVLLLDRSGSMGEGGKAALLSEAVEACLRSLAPRDRIAAAFFSDHVQWLVPAFRERDPASAKLRNEVRRVEPFGETDLYGAVEEASRRFEVADDGSAGGPRHLLVVSDGRARGDFAGLGARLAAARVRTSVIATGEDADEASLRALTRDGRNGRFDRLGRGADGRISLFDLVQQDLSEGDIRDGESAVVERDPAAWITRPASGFPPVRGWVRTHAKKRATIHLATSDGDPLFSSWRAGRGTAVAFASDPASSWALAYGAPSSTLGEAARHAAREAPPASDFWFERDPKSGGLRLVAGASAPEAGPRRLVASVSGLTGTLDFEPCGPGSWCASAPSWPPGSYLVSLSSGDLERCRVPLDLHDVAEFEVGPPDRDRLTLLAAETGGEVGDAPPLGASGNPRPGSGAARSLLIAAALVLLVADLLAAFVRPRLQRGRAPGR